MVDREGFIVRQAYPAELDFYFTNRNSGFNSGTFDEILWDEFFKDESIEKVQVRLLKTDDTEILSTIFGLQGYFADNYRIQIPEADREGNDPIDVEVTMKGELDSFAKEHQELDSFAKEHQIKLA
jgi:hypothetical protein